MSKYLIIHLLLYSTCLFSQETKPIVKKSSAIDRAHGELSASVKRLSNKIDSFFGSKRGEDSANGSQVRFTYLTNKTEHQDLDHEGLVKFRLKLPYLEKLLKISFKSKPKENKESAKDKKAAEGTKPTTASTIAKTILSEPKKWSFHFNTGIRVQIPPQFFANLRLRRSAYFGKWEFRATQEFFWYSRDGFGETTTVDFDRPINNELLFRLRNLATWTDDEDTFSTEHGPQIFWRLSDRRAVSLKAVAQGTSRPKLFINNYQSSIVYRQLLYKTWFYMETGPTVDFAKSNNWDSLLSYNIKFEVLIGSY